MAVKRIRKKTPIKKNQDELEDSQKTYDPDNDLDILDTKKENTKEIIEYKIYEAETEFKLKEIDSSDNKIIIGPPRLTRFEKARITGDRSLQLSLGAPSLISVSPDIRDSISLAIAEIDSKALPISIRRILPNGLYQDIPIDWLRV